MGCLRASKSQPNPGSRRMWNRIRSFFGFACPVSREVCGRDELEEDLARRRLQSLREQELSLGAHLRRGAPVSRGPGQVFSEKGRLEPVRQAAVTSATRDALGSSDRSSRSGDGTAGSDNSSGDFATSMAMGAATGDAALGYLMGGSIAGGLVGASLSDSSACDTCSDSGGSSCSD